MALLCPRSRRTGFGVGSPGFSGSSQTRMWPRLLPAATRRVGPRKVTAVTQAASHGRVQARAALSNGSAMTLPQQGLDRLRPLGGQPDGPGAGIMLGPRVDAQGRVEGGKQVAL